MCKGEGLIKNSPRPSLSLSLSLPFNPNTLYFTTQQLLIQWIVQTPKKLVTFNGYYFPRIM